MGDRAPETGLFARIAKAANDWLDGPAWPDAVLIPLILAFSLVFYLIMGALL
jgi:hypothetical protein